MRLKSKANIYLCLLLLLSLFLILLKLGFWQLDRAQEKERYQQQLAQRMETTLSTLPELNAIEALNQQSIELSGYLLHQYTILLDNVVKRGQVGYQVLVPFRLNINEEQLILINLGWVSAGLRRDILPSLSHWKTLQNIRGQLHIPTSNPYLLTAPVRDTWPKVVAEIDFKKIDLQFNEAQAIKSSLYPAIVRLDNDSEIGYQKEWRWSNKMTIDKHIGYAVQWFALSGTLLMLSGYFIFRLRKERQCPIN
ncbi:MAG: SURF1 family protein [Psychrobium sp.]|nr:SURF1 family protein [Psychrobium sp.]